jgi:hypothetical protein
MLPTAPSGLPDWERAIELNNENKYHAQLRAQRALTRARLGNHAQAAGEANALLEDRTISVERLYDAACVFALSAAAARDEGKLAGSYAARAVALLRLAMEKGYKDVEHLRSDPDLASLRSRKDFQQLVQEWKKSTTRSNESAKP